MLVLQSILLAMGIEAFGFLKYIAEQYFYSNTTKHSEENKKIQIVSQKTCVSTLDEYGLRFWPPLYVQRYTVVQEIIEHPIWNGSIKKVVEFGCSELNFFFYLKSNHQINNAMFVDIDYNVLETNKGKVMPTNYDYLSSSQRKQPLVVDIYEGSIADLDDRMLGVDAVIGIELIEHLYSDVLQKVPLTVFGFIKPKLAVFTTPNAEFNVLFPNKTTKYRHPDHKFEWSRDQLKEWANNIINTYPEYTVEFDGIGSGPDGTENLGCCSQVAIFYRKNMEISPANPTGYKPYQLLKRVDYPYKPPNEIENNNEIVLKKIRTFVSEASTNNEFIVDDRLKIPLLSIMPHVSDNCTCIKELEYIASKEYHTQINSSGEWVLVSNLAESSLKEYYSDSNSSLKSSGWLSDNDFKEEEEEEEKDDDDDWSVPVNVGSSHSKLCYSTPMAKNQNSNETFSNNLNGNFSMSTNNTISSNSDFFTTAIENHDTINDMEISSSCNNSHIINNCDIYQDFVTGRNDSTIKNEDISETEEETFICNENCNNNDKVNADINNKNSLNQNSTNVNLKSNCGSDIAHELTSTILYNLSSGVINVPDVVCSNRTLLDENDYTETLLSTPDKNTQHRTI